MLAKIHLSRGAVAMSLLEALKILGPVLLGSVLKLKEASFIFRAPQFVQTDPYATLRIVNRSIKIYGLFSSELLLS